ncbi:LuxR C-terminal-related transcriptional regulator [Kibdelosporangium philippinense]|uniref:LuxR C-terminal-related transcriptional regulator n=2 Tax=Kibdelosporangium philippinense TaxID=211113 RepID=A0ABS8Z9D4_9PSEU|nr:LuxR C-terminal-related transcriptional regulator [Kibdelosporangium philippinense]MCE7004142.1 LuxR C-terminal-related transcriptional regulator [Kibdelosporangium philippinense]
MPDSLLTGYQRVLDLAVDILDNPESAPSTTIATTLASILRSNVAFYIDIGVESADVSAISFDRDPGAFRTMMTVAASHPLFQHYRDTGTHEVLDARTLLGGSLWRNHEIFSISRALLDIREHVTIPLGAMRGYSLGRSDGAYSAAELALLERVQALLMSLDRHQRTYRHWHTSIASPARAAEVAEDFRLTSREITVLHLLAQARTAPSIARQLRISPRTVHKHVENLYRKLGTSDRLSAIQRAHALGLLQFSDTPGEKTPRHIAPGVLNSNSPASKGEQRP